MDRTGLGLCPVVGLCLGFKPYRVQKQQEMFGTAEHYQLLRTRPTPLN